MTVNHEEWELKSEPQSSEFTLSRVRESKPEVLSDKSKDIPTDRFKIFQRRNPSATPLRFGITGPFHRIRFEVEHVVKDQMTSSWAEWMKNSIFSKPDIKPETTIFIVHFK